MPYRVRKPRPEPFFAWSSKVETGIRIIDTDHRSLVDVVNECHADWAAGHFADTVKELMNELFRYCTDHFFREEKIMEQYRYPGLEVHKERHRGILRFVYALRVVAREDPYRIDPEKMLNFLRDWLVNHIGKSDMDYVAHIQDHLSRTGPGGDAGEPHHEPHLEETTLNLLIRPDSVLVIQHAAEILRSGGPDALELEHHIQKLLTHSTFEIPKDHCYELVHDLLR